MTYTPPSNDTTNFQLESSSYNPPSNDATGFQLPPPPSTPQNLTSTVSQDDITLNWDAVNWYEYKGHYNIYRAQSSGASTSDYTDIADVSSGTTTYTDSGLVEGEQYYYRVDAVNSEGGSSSLSNETNNTTVLPAPSDLVYDDSVDGELTVSWTKNDANDSGTFEVERAPKVGTNWSTIVTGIAASTTSYTDTTISAATEYKYRIIRDTDHERIKSDDVVYEYYPRVRIV